MIHKTEARIVFALKSFGRAVVTVASAEVAGVVTGVLHNPSDWRNVLAAFGVTVVKGVISYFTAPSSLTVTN